MKLVYVEWLDSYGVGAHWTQVKKIQTPELTCKSVGWIVSEDETMICVCPHLTQDDHEVGEYSGCGEMHIPRVSIVRLIQLSLPGDPPQVPVWPDGNLQEQERPGTNRGSEEPSRQLLDPSTWKYNVTFNGSL